MATRAKIHIATREEGVSFSEKPEKVMVSIYNHYDGYPEGLGVKLASYLDGWRIVNGMGREDDTLFNGLGCMAASIIAELKDGPGNVYMEDPNKPHTWIDYEYYVWGDDYKDIWISIFSNNECIFVGRHLQLLDKYTD